jgi:hypothetical protein
LIHVLEHLDDLSVDLGPAIAALEPGGAIAIQVPDLATQPSDVYVADHRHHFRKATLARALHEVGFPARTGPENVVAGELTAIGERGALSPGDDVPEPRETDAIAGALFAAESSLLALAETKKPAVIFGAGMLGALVASVLGDAARGFVDDDVTLHGRSLLGRPIAAAESLTRGTRVIVAVPPSVVARVVRRCAELGLDAIPFVSLPVK